MVEKGKLFTCERCKESIFISDKALENRFVPENEEKIMYPERWNKKFGMDLCPNCSKAFDDWLRYVGKIPK